MTAALDAKTKRLRAMTPGQIADAAGQAKARIADENDGLAELKNELIRRELTEANGSTFRVTLSPPGVQHSIDKSQIEATFTASYIAAHLMKETATTWVMRVNARVDTAASRLAA